MNEALRDVIERLEALPDDRQQQAAFLLLDFLEADEEPLLTPEQVAEVKRRLAADPTFASDEEVRSVFDGPAE